MVILFDKRVRYVKKVENHWLYKSTFALEITPRAR